jgi:hypothetical protein
VILFARVVLVAILKLVAFSAFNLTSLLVWLDFIGMIPRLDFIGMILDHKVGHCLFCLLALAC